MKKVLFATTALLIGGTVMALTEKEKTLCDVAAATARGVANSDIAEILASACTEDDVSPFRAGTPNTRYRQYFSGRSWLASLTKNAKETGVPIHNVTFEPGCRNSWHSHTGGQVLVCVGGEGWYRARGEKAVKMLPGSVVEIPGDVEHWHGAGPATWFAHLAITCHPDTNKTAWLEPVSDADYAKATEERGTRAEPREGHAEPREGHAEAQSAQM